MSLTLDGPLSKSQKHIEPNPDTLPLKCLVPLAAILGLALGTTSLEAPDSIPCQSTPYLILNFIAHTLIKSRGSFCPATHLAAGPPTASGTL